MQGILKLELLLNKEQTRKWSVRMNCYMISRSVELIASGPEAMTSAPLEYKD